MPIRNQYTDSDKKNKGVPPKMTKFISIFCLLYNVQGVIVIVLVSSPSDCGLFYPLGHTLLSFALYKSDNTARDRLTSL